jgi:hypothetical protein
MPGNSEEKDRGLTGGIAPADKGDLLVPAEVDSITVAAY